VAAQRAKQRKHYAAQAVYQKRLEELKLRGTAKLSLDKQRQVRQAANAQWKMDHPSAHAKLTDAQRQTLKDNPAYQAALGKFATASRELNAARSAALGRA
jgi:hypothetical protein